MKFIRRPRPIKLNGSPVVHCEDYFFTDKEDTDGFPPAIITHTSLLTRYKDVTKVEDWFIGAKLWLDHRYGVYENEREKRRFRSRQSSKNAR